VIIREAIRLGVERWPAVERMFARIDPVNEPSIRAFQAAGFSPDRSGELFVRELRSAHNAAR
jgi:RimJ/RimL family protein N-acetyltransferase